MSIDFDKFSLIYKLADKKACLYPVVKINLDFKSADFDSFITVVGLFATATEASKACEWLENNMPGDKVIYLTKESQIKKWKGE